MQKINLINPEKGDIPYIISRFPDGEVQISLYDFDRKDRVCVYCRLTSAEDLFILTQVADILRRHDVVFSIHITYLMGMRMDRVMDFNRPFTLKVVVGILDQLGADHVTVFSPHSDRCFDLFKHTTAYSLYSEKWDEEMLKITKDYQIVLPDRGAVERHIINTEPPADVIICDKVRDLRTGKITSIVVTNPEALDGRPLLVWDDLCDAGGTFVGVAQAIRAVRPDADLNICVSHMVNPKGVENLSKTYNKVWFTNSYRDWKAAWEHQPTPFPENVIQIEVV